eukprot:CAMPEP_0203826364 /NCGR_PEP_ID=MMETSP0115-20131106/56479_1 /ASSEMBLY_ACC=CAM_ASM_000227 /TAXON_ID=33651 /ORGANISM="Bicosoecid sp, Strain ms1" /LENGTH=110 /DNA_ID=CAMNT_0050735411 /DNA_START=70 /DNA_END=399 /DNA_ORIENTATION=-
MAAAASGGAGGVSAGDVAVSVEGATPLRVHVCTWNVGNKMPRADFAPWIPAGGGDHDVIVVGLQESTYKMKPPKEDGTAEESDPDDEEAAEDGADTPSAGAAAARAAAQG